MSKRALVAGGAGFIGSHLCDLLLAKGYEVVCIDNLVTGRAQNIEAARKNPRFTFIEQDIIQASFPAAITGSRFDEIYNLASPASPVDFPKMPVFILETAAIGHRNLLELGRMQKARVLFASTSEIYGDPLEHPQVESYLGNVNTIGPRGCYDEAKRFGEAMSMAYHRQYGVEVRLMRIFNTYGSRMRPDDGRVIPNFFMQALQKQALTIYGDGSQTRSFCYVSDLVEGMFALMQSSERRPVNIGNPIERTVREMAVEINALTGNTTPLDRQPLPENDPKQRRPDITRAKESLGWAPKVGLEEGLRICKEYFIGELKRQNQA